MADQFGWTISFSQVNTDTTVLIAKLLENHGFALTTESGPPVAGGAVISVRVRNGSTVNQFPMPPNGHSLLVEGNEIELIGRVTTLVSNGQTVATGKFALLT